MTASCFPSVHTFPWQLVIQRFHRIFWDSGKACQSYKILYFQVCFSQQCVLVLKFPLTHVLNDHASNFLWKYLEPLQVFRQKQCWWTCCFYFIFKRLAGLNIDFSASEDTIYFSERQRATLDLSYMFTVVFALSHPFQISWKKKCRNQTDHDEKAKTQENSKQKIIKIPTPTS